MRHFSNRPGPASGSPFPFTILLGALILLNACSGGEGAPYLPTLGEPTAPQALRDDSTRIVALFRNRESGVEVEAPATIERLLSDDLEGSRHQRMIVRLSGGQTLLISHNIDLAPRIPATAGDTIRFRGDFEWNDRGGVVHWTHHDPQGRREGGFIEFAGRIYR